MAGIKHPMWNSLIPGQGKDFGSIQDPFERHAAVMGQHRLPFCKLCGKVIDMGPQEERRDWEYEMKVEMHSACIEEERQKRAAEQIKHAREEAAKPQVGKSLEEIIAEQYGVEVKKVGE